MRHILEVLAQSRKETTCRWIVFINQVLLSFTSPPRNGNFPADFCFSALRFFVLPRYLRAPSAEQLIFLWRGIGEAPPTHKKIKDQNVQNLARFQTTSNFDVEFLQKKICPKSDKYVIDRDCSHVRRKKSVKLWSTNNPDLDVYRQSYSPKSTSSENHNYFGS